MLNKFAFCAIVLMVFAVFLGCPDSQKESDDKAAEVESTEKAPQAVVKSAEDTEEKAAEADGAEATPQLAVEEISLTVTGMT